MNLMLKKKGKTLFIECFHSFFFRLSQEIQTINDSINEYAARLQKLKDGMKGKEQNLKLVDDNLKLKEIEKELEGLEAEKDSLSKALNEIVENESKN